MFETIICVFFYFFFRQPCQLIFILSESLYLDFVANWTYILSENIKYYFDGSLIFI